MPHRELQQQLERLGQAFSSNELAYLALTSKVEIPVRDRLAVRLHNALRNRYLVARECPERTDLAVFSRSEVGQHGSRAKPMLVLQAKAMYSYDAIPTRVETTSFQRHWLPQLERDLIAAAKRCSECGRVYGLLLATHPLGTVPRDVRGVVKYAGMINTRHSRYGGAELAKRMHKHVMPSLRKLGRVTRGSWKAGRAFDVPCEVVYWLVGPFRGTDRGND